MVNGVRDEEARSVAYQALNMVTKHEAVCAERYKNVLETLARIEKTVDANSLKPWTYVKGTVLIVGGVLTLLKVFEYIKLG